jgi:hypothetical protein
MHMVVLVDRLMVLLICRESKSHLKLLCPDGMFMVPSLAHKFLHTAAKYGRSFWIK